MPGGKSRRLVLVCVATVALAIVASGCVGYKTGSFRVAQTGGIGPLHLQLALCSGVGNTSSTQTCQPSDRTGESQSALGFLIPKGSVAPATLTAVPGPGATPITFAADAEFTKISREAAEAGEGGMPPGTEVVGYLSAPYGEKAGDQLEWTVDADFALPAAPDGGSFAGTFEAVSFIGWRQVDGMQPANRPFDCIDVEPVSFEIRSGCGFTEQLTYGLQQLKLGAPQPTKAFRGAKASLAFSLDFATTVAAPPSFALAASSTLPGAQATLAEPSFVAGAPDPTTHRAPLATRKGKVAIPANAKPGTYAVTLTATASSGGVVTQVATLQVTKPVIKFVGKPKLNKAKGTATLTVKVPSAGTVTASGKGVVKAQKKASKAKQLKLKITAKGRVLAQLRETGAAKVRAKIKFKPSAGAAVTKTKPITLLFAARSP